MHTLKQKCPSLTYSPALSLKIIAIASVILALLSDISLPITFIGLTFWICIHWYDTILYYAYLHFFLCNCILNVIPYVLMFLYNIDIFNLDIHLQFKTAYCVKSSRISPDQLQEMVKASPELPNPFSNQVRAQGLISKENAIQTYKNLLVQESDGIVESMDFLDKLYFPETHERAYTNKMNHLFKTIIDSYSYSINQLEASTDPLDTLGSWENLLDALKAYPPFPEDSINPDDNCDDGVSSIWSLTISLFGEPSTPDIQRECSEQLEVILDEDIDLQVNGRAYSRPNFSISQNPTDINFYIGEPEQWERWVPLTQQPIVPALKDIKANIFGPLNTPEAAAGAAGPVPDPIPTVDDQLMSEVEPEGES